MDTFMKIKPAHLRKWMLAAASAVFAAMTFSIVPVAALAGSAAPPKIAINTIPLNVVVPTHPQVMIALSNSMSMDSSDNIIDDANRDLTTGAPGGTSDRVPSSAIMTWSGASGGWTANNPTTSPQNYQVPAGFTAPVTGTTSGSTPYTANLNTYPITTSGGGYWGNSGYKCLVWAIVPIGSSDTSIPNPFQAIVTQGPPTNVPAPSGFPLSFLLWDGSQYWYFNNTTDGLGGTGYFSSRPAPYVFPDQTGTTGAINKVPSARALFHGVADELAWNGNAGLLPVGMGNGNPHQAVTNAIGNPPPAPPCGTGPGESGTPCPVSTPPTTKQICALWRYNPPGYTQPWTKTTNYTQQADNSASRLNIAKASIDGVIQAYGTQVDFGLMTYKNTGVGQHYSWAYYMSPFGGFTASDFSNTYQPPTYASGATSSAPVVLPSEWVNNPCYGNPDNGDCQQIANQLASELGYATGTPALNALGSYQFMRVANSSDDPSVNDVVLDSWRGNKFMLGGTLTPASPYTGFNLQDYNCGGSCSNPDTQVVMNYSLTAPNLGGNGSYNLYPTNSGYVPYSPQVIASFRGEPWYGTPNATQGNVRVPVTAAAGVSVAQQQAYLQNFSPYLTPENEVQSTDTVDVPGVSPAITYWNYYHNAIKASAVQSPVAGMLSTALSSSNWPSVNVSNGCIPPRYVILITDGLPTEDLNGNDWPPPGSAAAVGYGATVAFNSDGTLDTAGTNNQAVIDAINTIANLNNAGIKTFVVGMGAGVDPSLNPSAAGVLRAMAIAGGTRNYYPGSSPAAVVAQLNAVLSIINALNVASVSGAVSTTALNTSTMVYQAAFTGYDAPYKDWTGDLRAYPVNSTNGIVSTTPAWSAQSILDTQNWDTGRLIATCGTTPDAGCAPNSGVPFRWPDLSSADQAALEPLDALGSDRLNYLRGDTSNYGPGGDDFRPRSHILGDIVDSAPLYVAASNGPYQGMSGYTAFAESTNSRTPMIYVGANDGMLHAFNAATGKEDFAFIPNGVLGKLASLSNPNYNNGHQFFVDGSPTAGDVEFSNSTWHTVLAGGLGDGGNSIYALDITKPSAITTETVLKNDVLWEFTDADLGLTYSQPAFALTADTGSANANPNGFMVFFGSGYNNADGNPYLYAVNAQTGKLVSKLNLCAAVSGACNSSLANGLSGVTVVNNSGDVGGPATTVYAGDLQGNLWKIDISNPNPSNWVVSRLFQACYPVNGGGCTPQPITTTPVVTLNPDFPSVAGTVVYFGTGEYLGMPDISNAHPQSFYGVLDSGTATNLARTNLVQQTLTTTTQVINGNEDMLRTVTNHTVNWNTEDGWFMDLPIVGERVVTNPRLYNGEVVFTTYVPTAGQLCQGGGQSFLMVLNYKNGSSFPQPQLDLNGDFKLNAADQVGGQNPVGISLGNVYASAPTILAADLGADKAVKITTISTPTMQSSGNFVTVGEAGGQASAVTWTQIH